MLTLRRRNLSAVLSLFLMWSFSTAFVRPLQAQDQPRPEDRKVPAAEAIKQITEDYDYLANVILFSKRPVCPQELANRETVRLYAQLTGLAQAQVSASQEFLTYHRSALART